MATYTCENKSCRKQFTARVADRNRGWARFCSKSCKAIAQTRRTGYAGPNTFCNENDWEEDALNAMEEGWDGHKVWFGG